MARIIVRTLASICLILGAVAIFISVNGGTVQFRLPGSSPAPDQIEHDAFIITLPNALPIGVSLIVASIVFFGVSRKLRRTGAGDERRG